MVYIFGTFFQFVLKFHYGHVGLLFFKEEDQHNCHQIVKQQTPTKVRKGDQSVPILKKHLEKFDIKL